LKQSKRNSANTSHIHSKPPKGNPHLNNHSETQLSTLSDEVFDAAKIAFDREKHLDNLKK
jgi:hypothetical protein